MTDTPTVGLLVTMHAKPGKEREVEQFLDAGLPLVNEEAATLAWFAVRLEGSRYGIFDVFADEAGRNAHLNGKVAAALISQAPDLFTGAPDIQRVDVLAAKLP